jgi:hypothetical protein
MQLLPTPFPATSSAARAFVEQTDPRRLNLPKMVVSQGDVEVHPSGDLEGCVTSKDNDSKESKE